MNADRSDGNEAVIKTKNFSPQMTKHSPLYSASQMNPTEGGTIVLFP